MNAILYIYGKGGSAAESEHYKPLFPDYDVMGLDYQTFTPWDTGKELTEQREQNDARINSVESRWKKTEGQIRIAIKELKGKYEDVILIANSIGAFFSMNAGIDDMIQKAYFISPIVNMEKLITDMMQWANVSESELESEGIIHTDYGEDLSWDYLSYVRSNPIKWRVPTQILYGGNDHLTSLETITDFANMHQATLTIMENGEHWFHTEEQMIFLRLLDKGIDIMAITEDRLRQTFSERLRVGATAGMGGAQEIYQEVKVSSDFLGFARRYAFSEDYFVARSALWGMTKASKEELSQLQAICH